MADEIFGFDSLPCIKGYPELHWSGKKPYKNTCYYDAQEKESYGKDVNEWKNKLYWGDNLQVMSHMMREYRGKVDLIYIDPPFDSKADYKKKIELRGYGSAESDRTSFEEKQYGDIWTNDGYLQYMYERLILMKELLKDTGSIYLHCDWHKSHHLRMLMDEVFGVENFVNEIVWCYQGTGKSLNQYKRKHDTILFYAKTKNWKFNALDIGIPFGEKQKKKFSGRDENGYFKSYKHSDGKIYKKYLTEDDFLPCNDWWSDIYVIQDHSERLNYPTQKPEALLERIIKASSNPGDLVFDCFCGSGTTGAVAMKLSRRFILADINLGAIDTTKKRLLKILNGEKKETEYNLFDQKDEHNVYDISSLNIGDKGEQIAADSTLSNITYEENDYTSAGFSVYNVNNYDLFRNPVEGKNIIMKTYEVQPLSGGIWDGELDGRMVKIMPINRIAGKEDLNSLISSLPYKEYDKIKEKDPSEIVERITIICMGHVPDLKEELEKSLSEYKVDIEILDVLRDKKELTFKHEAEAEIERVGNKLVIRNFFPRNLMQKLSKEENEIEDWRVLTDSVLIDWNYDGVTLEPSVIDIPEKNGMVNGVYDIPKDAGTIRVKITDLLSESIEKEL